VAQTVALDCVQASKIDWYLNALRLVGFKMTPDIFTQNEKTGWYRYSNLT